MINGAGYLQQAPSGLKAAQGTHSAQIHKKLTAVNQTRWGYVPEASCIMDRRMNAKWYFGSTWQ